jgi:hypothetical protein
MVLSGEPGESGRDPRLCADTYTGRTTKGIVGFFMNFSA